VGSTGRSGKSPQAALRLQRRSRSLMTLTIPDPDVAIDEERFVIIRMSSKRRLLIVVHTIRGEQIRLISARAATKHEKRNYEEPSH
jgi:uncharacterized DUF497 family protein